MLTKNCQLCLLKTLAKNLAFQVCRYRSVDSSAPTILPPWVRFPSTQSTLLSFIVFVLYLSLIKNWQGLAHSKIIGIHFCLSNQSHQREFKLFKVDSSYWLRSSFTCQQFFCSDYNLLYVILELYGRRKKMKTHICPNGRLVACMKYQNKRA